MKKNALILCVAVSTMLLHAPVRAQQWKELGTGTAALNANGGIEALAIDKNGNVYAGGAFRSFVGNPHDIFYVAKWNGSTWTDLGTGAAALNADNPIRTIATDTFGNVYAAGNFTNLGQSQLNHYVAKWNGSTWQELGTGSNVLAANYNILSVVTDPAGNVYAAGNFTDETLAYRYVAKWNGNTWSKLGGVNFNGDIYTLASDKSGNVYAAGSFSNTSGDIYVAKWNGSSWQQLGGTISSNLTDYNLILAMAVDDLGNVYIGGKFTDSNDKYYVAKLSGNNWVPLGTGASALNANGIIKCLAIGENNSVHAAGYFANSSNKFYVAKWTGSSWTEVGQGSNALNANGSINAILTDKAMNLYAGGGFDNAQSRFYVAKYGDSVITEGPTAITNAFDRETIRIVPNPATAEISVTNIPAGYTELSILNISGATVLNRKIIRKDEPVQISRLSPGIYVLKLTGAKGNAVFKFVKE